MKILHVVESFGGGVLTSVSQLCNLQAADGHEVILAHSLRVETPANYRDGLDPGIGIIKLNLVRPISPLRDVRGMLEVHKLIKEIEPDILHLHSSKAGFLGRAALLWGLGKKPKTFYSPRGFAFLRSDIGNIQRWIYFLLERIGVLLGGSIIACSKSEAEEAKKLKVKNVFVVDNAVDTSIIPVKNEAAEDAHLNIGTSGRICAQKNPALFRAIAEYFQDKDGVRFVWIGHGEDEHQLSSLTNLKITGWLPRIQALVNLTKLDIYIQTSLWEGMPLSVIEAMVSGIPVVVRDAVGNRDAVIHGETGFIAANLDEMIFFINLLARDNHLRLTMGQKARQVALERFSLDRLKAEMNRLYLEWDL